MYVTLKTRTYLLLDPNKGGTMWDRLINSFIVSLIILNTLAVILETVNSFYNHYKPWFQFVETLSVIVFSIEYILRLWVSTSIEKFSDPIRGRMKYICTPGAIIDLVAILPFYLPLLAAIDLRFIRVLRLVRFLRFFKLGRFLNASKVINNVFKAKKDELSLSVGITLVLIIVASSVMYFVEHDAQPDKFSSIPETMWWSVATLTTVGYGDMFPITTLGKTLTAFISILGIGMFALPAGILASGFSDELKKNKQKTCCPHCNKEIE